MESTIPIVTHFLNSLRPLQFVVGRSALLPSWPSPGSEARFTGLGTNGSLVTCTLKKTVHVEKRTAAALNAPEPSTDIITPR